MTETELYKQLGALTKNRTAWEASIPHVSSLLALDSDRIKAKALWMLGEMGLAFPAKIEEFVPAVASFLGSPEPLLRERSIHALGRIGRGRFEIIGPYWEKLFPFALDEEPRVRLSFIWASENIATNTPDPYKEYMSIYGRLLDDPDDRVRMEAPEMFRVLGRRRPRFVKPYLDRLQALARSDSNRVVRIHCLGAVRAASPASRLERQPPGIRHAPAAPGDCKNREDTI